MPRKGEVPKRKPLPDPKFTDQPVDTRRRVTKFVNTVMKSGKKAIAERIVYGAFDIVAEKAKDDPVKVWDRALSNVKPKVEVKSRRVGGATYQVPVDVRPDRAIALGHALADHRRRATAPTAARCRRSWRASCSTLRPTRATRSRSAKTRTRWPTPTRRSLTIAGSQTGLDEDSLSSTLNTNQRRT